MTVVINRHSRAAEYQRLALQASELAEASDLDHVRQKHRLAAATWNALAAGDTRAPRAPATAHLTPELSPAE